MVFEGPYMTESGFDVTFMFSLCRMTVMVVKPVSCLI